MAKASDDLDAVRVIVEALTGFDPGDQERVLRWAREKLGLQAPATPAAASPAGAGVAKPLAPHPQPSGGHTDIKSFIAAKKPASDNQFAAAVAYYYRFEAPPAEQKQAITADDLQEACRKASRPRLRKPIVTLHHAHNMGLLDKAGRGEFAINTVGENLVAMTLPGAATPMAGTKRPGSKKSKKK
jgi:hypothetical protein